MKTSVDVVSGVERKITVEIPAEEVDRRIEQEFTELRRMVPVRGFRKGKAPMEMVKRLFRDSVESEVSEHLVKESITEVVKEKELKVLSMPGVEGAKVVPGKDFVFSATVEVVPEVEPVDYKGIPVVREKVNVTDEGVSSAIERLREQFAQFHAVEGRGAVETDLVEFGFTAVAGEETVERNDSTAIVPANSVPYGEEFGKQMLGVEPGTTRSFDIVYPAEFPYPKFAGKTVTFEVKVAGLREKTLPEMDDAFAKQFGDVSGVDDLKGKVRERLVAEGEEHSRQHAEESLRKALAERNPFDIPATLIKRQTIMLMQDTFQRLSSQGVDLKKMNLDVDKMAERFSPNAERMVRVSLLIDAIARKENIEVSYPEIDTEMKALAEGQGLDYEKVREMYSSEERMDTLRDRLLERKVINFLMENAAVTEGAPE